MDEKIKTPKRVFTLILAVLILLVSLPTYAYASIIEDAPVNSEEAKEVQTSEKDTFSSSETVVIEELCELREENVKHFRLSNGEIKAVAYAQAVHYKDEGGKWVDIDNTLTLNGSEYSSSNKSEIKFANKSGSNGLVSIKDGEYKIDFTPLDTNKVSVVIENPQEENSRKFEDVSRLNNTISRAIYEGIYDGIDLEYILVGNNIKENIIVKEKQASYTFSFELELNKLSAELVNGAIILSDYDSGERVYEIPAPYMYDANGVYSTAVEYTLEQQSKWKYTLTVSASAEFINAQERAFPVTIDPTITADASVIDTFFLGDGVDYSDMDMFIVGNFLEVYKDSSAFIKFTSMPQLPTGATLVDAKLALFFMIVESDNENEINIGVYEATSDWTSNFESTSISGFYDENSLMDYLLIEESGAYEWNITSLYEKWQSGGTNNGICVKTINLPQSANIGTRISSSENTQNYLPPQLEITYRDAKGIEGYWAYASQSAGSAGKGSVNLATGNLVFELPALSTTDGIFGFNTSLIYNTALAGKAYQYPNAQVGYSSSYVANGFKLNATETLIKSSYKIGNSDVPYYIWTDGDGTEHYFYFSSELEEGSLYYDEDGLQLTLIADTIDDGSVPMCKITDSNHTERIFRALTYYLGDENLTSWYLKEIKDKNGNTLKFTFDSSKRITGIKLVPRGSSTEIDMLTLAYNSDHKLMYIWSKSSGDCILFRHSQAPTGSLDDGAGGSYLREALHLKLADTITRSDLILFSCEYDNEYTGITVNAVMKYEYDTAGRLISAHDTLSGYKVSYTYTSGKVTRISESTEKSSVITAGTMVGIDYKSTHTEVRSAGTDNTYGNDDDIINVYVFDNNSRVVSTYSTNVQRNLIYGAVNGNYEDEVERAKNSISTSTVTGMTYANYLLNGNFELSETEALCWLTNGALQTNTDVLGWSNSALCLSTNGTSSSYLSQNVTLEKGKYTLSFDLSGVDTQGLVIMVEANSNDFDFCEQIPTNDYFATGSGGFASCEFEVTNEAPTTVCIEIYIYAEQTLVSPKSVTVDNIMLSKSLGASAYNYLNFGSFENIQDLTGSIGEWSSQTPNNYLITNSESANGFDSALQIGCGITNEISVDQTVYIASQSAIDACLDASTRGRGSTSKPYVFTISGFGKTARLTKNNESAMRIALNISYLDMDDGAQAKTITAYASFGIEGAWHYSSATTVLPKSAFVTEIKVSCQYFHNSGSAYFDNISLMCENGFETRKYEYYDTGKLKAEIKDELDIVAFYEYDENENTKRVIAKDSFTAYTYDSRNNVTSSDTYGHSAYMYASSDYSNLLSVVNETKILKVSTTYTYDYNDTISTNGEYGFMTKQTVYDRSEANSGYVQSEYEYETSLTSKIFGVQKSETASFGKKTQYFYDETNGSLISVINPDNTGYYYTYNDLGNLVMVQPATYTTSATPVSNSTTISYTYNSENLLSKITANGTEYELFYDSFGKETALKIGGSEIVSQQYGANNGKLESVTYANGTVITYEYDELSRLTKKTYTNGEQSAVYRYTYDSNGNLNSFVDEANDRSTIYKYDNSNKLIKVIESDTDSNKNLLGVGYSYNDEGKVSHLRYNKDYLYQSSQYYRASIINSYFYNTQTGNLLKIDVNINGLTAFSLSYIYDGFERYTKKTLNVYGSSNTVSMDVLYGYLTSNGETSTIVSSYVAQVKKNGSTNGTESFYYEYDEANRNIVTVYMDEEHVYRLAKYEYDERDRLVRENSNERNKTYVYEYDNNGNILSEKVYAYTEVPDLSSAVPTKVNTYTYSNAGWKDQLTSYNGNQITYDQLGNPISYYNGTVFSWNNVNNLASATKGETSITYAYNDEGLRISKTVNGVEHKYTLDGSKIVSEEFGDVLLIYIYDELNQPIGIAYRKNSYERDVFEKYFFAKNLQGDILSIYNEAGSWVAMYRYNAWGEITNTMCNIDTPINELNPFRYRGYYYDEETSLYYLNSRYYDPQTKRFLNADTLGVLGATPTEFTDKNLYAYCDNNPIMRGDNGGEFWHIVAGAAIGAIIGGAVSAVSQLIENPEAYKTGEFWARVGVAAAFGGLGGALASTGAPVALQIVGSALLTGTGNFLDQGIEKGFEEVDYGEVAAMTAIGGLLGCNNGLSKGDARHLMKSGINATKKIFSKGFSNATKYYFSQTTKMFYEPLKRGIPRDIGYAFLQEIVSYAFPD